VTWPSINRRLRKVTALPQAGQTAVAGAAALASMRSPSGEMAVFNSSAPELGNIK
jgi:hypothetical protein